MQRILVVDDDPDVRTMLVEFLELRGHPVAARADGDSALQWLADNPADIVLLDLYMPGRPGIDVLGAIRESHPSTSVIVLSGSTDESLARLALKAGACDYLSKPMDLRALEMRIETNSTLRQAMGD